MEKSVGSVHWLSIRKFDDLWKYVVIGGYKPFHNYFLSCLFLLFSFYLLETQKFLWRLPGGQSLHTRFLELSCHNGIHPNCFFQLDFIHYHLEALLGVPFLWWNLQLPPHIPEIAVRQMNSTSSTHMKFPNKNARLGWRSLPDFDEDFFTEGDTTTRKSQTRASRCKMTRS